MFPCNVLVGDEIFDEAVTEEFVVEFHYIVDDGDWAVRAKSVFSLAWFVDVLDEDGVENCWEHAMLVDEVEECGDE